LAFARVPWDLRSDFDRHHLTETIGLAQIFNRLHDAIAAFEEKAKQVKAGDPSPEGAVDDAGGPRRAQ